MNILNETKHRLLGQSIVTGNDTDQLRGNYRKVSQNNDLGLRCPGKQRVRPLNKMNLAFSRQKRENLTHLGMAGRDSGIDSAGQREVREGGAEHGSPRKPRTVLSPSGN